MNKNTDENNGKCPECGDSKCPYYLYHQDQIRCNNIQYSLLCHSTCDKHEDNWECAIDHEWELVIPHA